jgi:hypothetical protein
VNDLALPDAVSVRSALDPLRPYGEPSPDQLVEISRHTRAQLRPDEVFVLPATLSTDQDDAYFTLMDESSLRNYAGEARLGRPVMSLHKTAKHGIFGTEPGEQPIGRVFHGEFVETDAGRRTDTLSYLVRGYHPNGQSQPGSDDFIAGIRSGIQAAISIGFSVRDDGSFRCTVCERDMLHDEKCDHLFGGTYELPSGEKRRARGRIVNAHFREQTLCAEGATPGCVTLKAERLLASGLASDKQVRALEDEYGVRMLRERPATQWMGTASFAPTAGPGIITSSSRTLLPQEVAMTPQEFARSLGISDAPADLSWEGLRAAVVSASRFQASEQALAAANERAERAEAETARLRPLADERTQLRSVYIEEALADGVRAEGTDFPREAYASMFDAAPIETIRSLGSGWRSRALASFGSLRSTDPNPSGREGEPQRSYEQGNDGFQTLPRRAVPEAFRTMPRR